MINDMSLHIIKITITLAVIIMATDSIGADNEQTGDIKQLEGFSIVGDKEAPKSLYIVPWHNAELNQNASLPTNLIDNNMQAVDRESFHQQLRLYELSKSGWYRITAGEP